MNRRALRKLWRYSHLILIFAAGATVFYVLKRSAIISKVDADEKPIEQISSLRPTKNETKRNLSSSRISHVSKFVQEFTVMTFNTWNSGGNVENGLEKIADAIDQQNPDIVGLQEMYEKHINKLINSLKMNYEKCSKRNGNNFILTRWKVAEEYNLSSKFYHQGCKIDMASFYVNVWNVHLPFQYLGFEKACQIEADNSSNNDAIFEGEFAGRGRLLSRFDSVTGLYENKAFKKNIENFEKEATFVMGDFNTASHLDWIDDAKHLHCNWTVTWPITKLMERIKFVDSFREVHANPLEIPGQTLMYVPKYNDFPDRIDYIFYTGSKVKPLKSYTAGHSHLINGSTWPSDHKALVTIFKRL